MRKNARLRAGVVAVGALLTLPMGIGTASASTSAQEALCDPHEGLVCLTTDDVTNERVPPVASGSCRRTDWYFKGVINYTGYYQRKWENSDCTGQNMLVAPGENLWSSYWGKSLGGY
jgi:hypothetical protein